MTCRRGIIHQEMPKGDAKGAWYGFQLWANLPAANKMMDPRYGVSSAPQIPPRHRGKRDAHQGGSRVVDGVKGPVTDVVTAPSISTSPLPAGATFTRPTPRGHTVLAYVIAARPCSASKATPIATTPRGATTSTWNAARF